MFLFLVIAIITISSCAKPECKTSADCSARTCYLSKCEDKKCSYTLQRNCCGNRINESIEDGKPGNQCTCPQDYGKCEGKTKTKVGSRVEEAKYVRYYCNVDNQCVLGIDKNDVTTQTILDSINIGLFKASSVVKYNKPFDVSRNSFTLTISLEDTKKELVLPIVITKIRLLYNSEVTRTEQLIAEKELSEVLNGIGDEVTINVPLNLNYKPQDVEEVGTVRYVFDYMYKKQVVSGKVNATTIYTNETVRASFNAPGKPLFLVRSE